MKSDGKQDDIQQTATSRIWTWVWTSCPSGGAAWTGGVLQFLLFMSFMFSNVFTSLPFLCQYIFLLSFVSFYSHRALTDVIVNGGQSSKDLSNINILIEVIAAHLSKGTRAESKLSSAIRSEVCFVQKCCVGLISLWRNVFVSQTPKTLTKEYVASWNLLVNISKRQDCALHMNAEHFWDDS